MRGRAVASEVSDGAANTSDARRKAGPDAGGERSDVGGNVASLGVSDGGCGSKEDELGEMHG
jgi:hypothetical protein